MFYCALKHSIEREKSPTGRDILGQLVQNAEIAREEEVAICQDCGLAVIFAEVGQDVHIEGDFEQAVNDGVIMGYEDGYLRKSTCTPFYPQKIMEITPLPFFMFVSVRGIRSN